MQPPTQGQPGSHSWGTCETYSPTRDAWSYPPTHTPKMTLFLPKASCTTGGLCSHHLLCQDHSLPSVSQAEGSPKVMLGSIALPLLPC